MQKCYIEIDEPFPFHIANVGPNKEFEVRDLSNFSEGDYGLGSILYSKQFYISLGGRAQNIYVVPSVGMVGYLQDGVLKLYNPKEEIKGYLVALHKGLSQEEHEARRQLYKMSVAIEHGKEYSEKLIPELDKQKHRITTEEAFEEVKKLKQIPRHDRSVVKRFLMKANLE